MKFLRNKKLKQLGAYLLVLTVLIFVVEYFLLGREIAKLEEAELKQQYTRVAQLANQDIALSVQDYLAGKEDVAPLISSLITEQEHRLRILAHGGRVEQRDQFIEPLSRLPKITLDGLTEDWSAYKASIYSVIQQDKADPIEEPAVEIPTDSTDTVAQAIVPLRLVSNAPSPKNASLQYKGLSLTMGKWYDKLMQDLDEEVESKRSALFNWRIVLLTLNLLVATAVFFLFQKHVVSPLATLKSNIAHQVHSESRADEIGDVALQANATIEHLKDAADFIQAIGKGNLNISYKESFDKNYVPGQNRLADSLIEMQAKLRELNEEEQKRQWANEGLTRFVDILRSSNDNLHVLGDKIVAGLVQYTRSNQGALYILNDEDEANRFLELISLFAYDVKKYEQNIIKPGQGILGQTFLEKETTYLTSLPDEYIRITSGLGGATPKSILIVPLKVDKDVYGLVELASFNEFQPHEIAFVEKLGESIASTLGSVRAAQKNKQLILQFKEQTEEMKAQEEEMRQNMEELQATQEEVVRKEKSYIQQIAELEKALQDREAHGGAEEAARRFAMREVEYKKVIENLQKELEQLTKKAEQWDTASEVSRALKMNLEAIRITQEELDSKRKA
jgi:GAF domain-containing protein